MTNPLETLTVLRTRVVVVDVVKFLSTNYDIA